MTDDLTGLSKRELIAIIEASTDDPLEYLFNCYTNRGYYFVSWWDEMIDRDGYDDGNWRMRYEKEKPDEDFRGRPGFDDIDDIRRRGIIKQFMATVAEIMEKD